VEVEALFPGAERGVAIFDACLSTRPAAGVDLQRKRALAKEMNGDQAKEAMLGVADDPDRLARLPYCAAGGRTSTFADIDHLGFRAGVSYHR
jgi:hypothetical protein